jgi:hypothetical protein
MRNILITAILITLFSCKDPSTIKVQNSLSGAQIQNAEWGGIPITSGLMPGETSREVKVFKNNSYYGIDLPEKHPLKFYINLNGDLVYLETNEYFELGVEDAIFIEITDSTQVTNPLLDK